MLLNVFDKLFHFYWIMFYIDTLITKIFIKIFAKDWIIISISEYFFSLFFVYFYFILTNDIFSTWIWICRRVYLFSNFSAMINVINKIKIHKNQSTIKQLLREYTYIKQFSRGYLSMSFPWISKQLPSKKLETNFLSSNLWNKLNDREEICDGSGACAIMPRRISVYSAAILEQRCHIYRKIGRSSICIEYVYQQLQLLPDRLQIKPLDKSNARNQNRSNVGFKINLN